MSRRISAPTRSRCSPSHCSPRTTTPRSSCSATPKCRSRTPRRSASAPSRIIGVRRSGAAMPNWPRQVRQDGIDVLVDLAGHTAGNRLLVFARKPAPVQIEYMIGHGCTSGLSAIDGFLADDVLAPPGAEAVFSEQLVRLPRMPLAYRPPDGMPPVAPLPAPANGCVTFGYFGRTVRLNDGVIAAWSRILHAVPGSRLVLNSAPYAEAGRTRRLDRAVRGPRHRPRTAGTGLHHAAATHLGSLRCDRHRAGSVPAQRRHHDDRGAVAGRPRADPGRPADGRPVRRGDPARRRTG